MNTLVTGGSGLVGSSIESEFKPTKEGLNLMNFMDICEYIRTNKIDAILPILDQVTWFSGYFEGKIIRKTVGNKFCNILFFPDFLPIFREKKSFSHS